jgi:hypothetical protein
LQISSSGSNLVKPDSSQRTTLYDSNGNPVLTVYRSGTVLHILDPNVSAANFPDLLVSDSTSIGGGLGKGGIQPKLNAITATNGVDVTTTILSTAFPAIASLGMGGVFTLQTTQRVFTLASGQVSNNTAGDGVKLYMMFGNGSLAIPAAGTAFPAGWAGIGSEADGVSGTAGERFNLTTFEFATFGGTPPTTITLAIGFAVVTGGTATYSTTPNAKAGLLAFEF